MCREGRDARTAAKTGVTAGGFAGFSCMDAKVWRPEDGSADEIRDYSVE
jgi:hypothetical protein